MTKKFELGKTIITKNIGDLLSSFANYEEELKLILDKHQSGDWGEIGEEEIEENEQSLQNRGRILSIHYLYGKQLWILTEGDRSKTTIFTPEDIQT